MGYLIFLHQLVQQAINYGSTKFVFGILDIPKHFLKQIECVKLIKIRRIVVIVAKTNKRAFSKTTVHTTCFTTN